MQIFTEYNLVWLIPIVLLATGYSLLLYYKNPRETFPKALNLSLAALRFVVVFLLGVLLLNPLLKTRSIEKQKPIIVMMQDVSESIMMTGDTSFVRNSYKNQFEELSEKLSEKYEVKKYAFGGGALSLLDWKFDSKSTDLSLALEEVEQRYKRLNLGAIVLASDGIYNKGSNPQYQSKQINRPIYTIALGDTTTRKDLRIQRVAYNEVAYLGNQFPIEIEVLAQKLNGKKSRLDVLEEGKKIFSKEILITSDDYSQQFRFYPEAKKSGTLSYQVILKEIEEEISTVNNRSRFFVEVIESRKKILILFDAPHPDIGAIVASFRDKDQYEIESIQAKKFNKSPEAYSLIITHQLPTRASYSRNLIRRIQRSEVPIFSFIGSRVDIPSFNNMGLGVQIQASRMQVNDALAIYNPNFDRFYLPESFIDLLPELPPLSSPFGKFLMAPGTHPVLFQKLGNVETPFPMAAVSEMNGRKSGFVMGEGIWKWRLYAYAQMGSHKGFDDWMEKMIQFISLSEEKKRFSVQANKKFLENESIIFTAQVFNPSYEALQEAEIEMIIKDEEGKDYDFSFGRRGSRFYLDAGRFPSGRYSCTASVKLKDETFKENGAFIVLPVLLEGLNITANHSGLQLIANETGAEMLYPNELQSLYEKLQAREDIASIRYEHFTFRDIIDWHWVLVILISLLGIEWFVRKYNGSY